MNVPIEFKVGDVISIKVKPEYEENFYDTPLENVGPIWRVDDEHVWFCTPSIKRYPWYTVDITGFTLCSEERAEVPPHPRQPLVKDGHGVVRFKKNKIVDDLTSDDLNRIFVKYENDYPEDYLQLMQLIGYSVSGYGDLSVVSDEEWEITEKQYDEFKKGEINKT